MLSKSRTIPQQEGRLCSVNKINVLFALTFGNLAELQGSPVQVGLVGIFNYSFITTVFPQD